MTLTRVAPWCALAAVALLGYLGWTAHLRSDAVLGERIRAREQVITAMSINMAALQTRIPKVDTVRKVDATGAAQWAARYAALRDSLSRSHEPLFVLRNGQPSIGVLAVADSAVASCTRALRSCEAAVAVRDTALRQAGALLAQKDSLLADVKRRHGPRFLGIPLGCTAGLAATPSGSGIGAACGVRIF